MTTVGGKAHCPFHDEELVGLDVIAANLSRCLGPAPQFAIVLGSGLGPLVDLLKEVRSATYRELGLPTATVPGHSGVAYRGRLGDVDVVVFAGRVHMYEGYPPHIVVQAVRAMWRWGIGSLFLTCSAGGIRDDLVPGSLVAISDHINLQGSNPLVAKRPGPRNFPDMGDAYCARMRNALDSVAAEEQIELTHGVYLAVLGPAYETPAEIRAYRTLGADMVGMSTAPEVLAAVELGLKVAAIAVVTNRAAGLSIDVLDHEDVRDVAGAVAPRVATLLRGACHLLADSSDSVDLHSDVTR